MPGNTEPVTAPVAQLPDSAGTASPVATRPPGPAGLSLGPCRTLRPKGTAARGRQQHREQPRLRGARPGRRCRGSRWGWGRAVVEQGGNLGSPMNLMAASRRGSCGLHRYGRAWRRCSIAPVYPPLPTFSSLLGHPLVTRPSGPWPQAWCGAPRAQSPNAGCSGEQGSQLASRPTAQWWVSAQSSVSQPRLRSMAITTSSHWRKMSRDFRVRTANLCAEQSSGHTGSTGSCPGDMAGTEGLGCDRRPCWGWWRGCLLLGILSTRSRAPLVYPEC